MSLLTTTYVSNFAVNKVCVASIYMPIDFILAEDNHQVIEDLEKSNQAGVETGTMG